MPERVAATAAVALWALLHGSEQARAAAKTQLSSYGNGINSPAKLLVHDAGDPVKVLRANAGSVVDALLFQ